jgi:hypothetical protein
MADDDDRAIKTVKGISSVAWEKGLKSAKKRDEPYGVWLGRAIERQADLEADDRVILPDEREDGQPASAPASAQPRVSFSLGEIEGAMRTAADLASAAGLEVPKPMARHYFALLTSTLRLARGLEPLKPRQTRRRIGQTQPKIGQTVIDG